MIDAEKLKEFIGYSRKLKILYVEDDTRLREDSVKFLSRFFTTIDCASNGQEGLQKYKSGTYDIIITDIRMPILNGIEMVRQIRADNKDQTLIITSAHDESEYLMELINLGVSSFVLKPIDVEKMLETLQNAANYIRLKKTEADHKLKLEIEVYEKTRELFNSQRDVKNLTDELLQRLVNAAEHKDTDTGKHIVRIGLYSKILAEALGMPKDFVEAIAFASPLHDIGKIGIQDGVLLKPGSLTPDEFKIMKTHTHIGAAILAGSSYKKIQMAETIALYHHERWDGTGYPIELRDKVIPLEARIVIICDQYDALMMKRPYKEALGHQRTVEILTKGDGRTKPEHFDPEVLNAFIKIAGDFEVIFNENMG
ncbi:MAG: response regulator [Nitrospirae bacterium]|nr:response regulator [Nitrospirota bacterium]